MHDLRGEVGLAHEVAARDRIVPRDLDGYVAVGTALAAAPNGDAGATQTDGRAEDVTALERVAELAKQLGGLLALDAAREHGSADPAHDGARVRGALTRRTNDLVLRVCEFGHGSLPTATSGLPTRIEVLRSGPRQRDSVDQRDALESGHQARLRLRTVSSTTCR